MTSLFVSKDDRFRFEHLGHITLDTPCSWVLACAGYALVPGVCERLDKTHAYTWLEKYTELGPKLFAEWLDTTFLRFVSTTGGDDDDDNPLKSKVLTRSQKNVFVYWSLPNVTQTIFGFKDRVQGSTTVAKA